MTGSVIDGREAHRIGFANRIAPADELEADHRGAVRRAAGVRAAGRGLAKRVIDAAAKPALEATLEQEVDAQELLAASDDFAEGASAFMEKRAPSFAGR